MPQSSHCERQLCQLVAENPNNVDGRYQPFPDIPEPDNLKAIHRKIRRVKVTKELCWQPLTTEKSGYPRNPAVKPSKKNKMAGSSKACIAHLQKEFFDGTNKQA
jgi:hypothetical protein